MAKLLQHQQLESMEGKPVLHELGFSLILQIVSEKEVIYDLTFKLLYICFSFLQHVTKTLYFKRKLMFKTNRAAPLRKQPNQ